MKKVLSIFLSVVLFFAFVSPSLASTNTSEGSDVIVDDGTVLKESVVEEVSETTGIDVSDVNLSTYEEDFSFLTNDPVFMELEEHLILTDQDVSIEENSVSGQWVPVAAAAIRLLTSTGWKKRHGERVGSSKTICAKILRCSSPSMI